MATQEHSSARFRAPLAILLASLIGILPVAVFLLTNAAGVGGAL